jgi:hypothetical protein
MIAPIRGVADFAKDTIIALLQEFFANDKNFPPEYLFNRDLSQSAILIADKYTYNLEDVEKRPAIVVIRGAQSWTRRGLDQFKGWVGDAQASEFTDLIQGSFSCTCMSRHGLEAESLAHSVFAFFQFFRRMLRDKTKGIHDVTSIILGEEMAAKTDSNIDVSVVPVQIVLMFQWKWKLTQVAPVFRDVDINSRFKNGEVLTQFLHKAHPPLVTV